MRIFTKDPDAVLDYTFDWTQWLAGDTISNSTWNVPAGLTSTGSASTATSATVWLSGGTAGLSYEVSNRITTANGRTDDRSIIIKVEQR